jgi:hypothetical protein
VFGYVGNYPMFLLTLLGIGDLGSIGNISFSEKKNVAKKNA